MSKKLVTIKKFFEFFFSYPRLLHFPLLLRDWSLATYVTPVPRKVDSFFEGDKYLTYVLLLTYLTYLLNIFFYERLTFFFEDVLLL